MALPGNARLARQQTTLWTHTPSGAHAKDLFKLWDSSFPGKNSLWRQERGRHYGLHLHVDQARAKWYLVPGYLTALNLRRSVYMPHPCGISYVVLDTPRYMDSTFIIVVFPIYCSALSGPTSRARRGSEHAVGQR